MEVTISNNALELVESYLNHTLILKDRVLDFSNGVLISGTFNNGSIFNGISGFECPHQDDWSALGHWTVILSLVILAIAIPFMFWMFGHSWALWKLTSLGSDEKMLAYLHQYESESRNTTYTKHKTWDEYWQTRNPSITEAVGDKDLTGTVV